MGKKNKSLIKLSISSGSIGWSAKNIKTSPQINLIKGRQYVVIVASETSKGCYGFVIGDLTENLTDFTAVSEDMGQIFKTEKGRKIKYSYKID